MSRTKKRPYTKSKRIDRTCRNHGSCPYCQSNRLIAARRREIDAKEQERLYREEKDEKEG